MDWGVVGGGAVGLVAIWAALIVLLWALKPTDVRLAELLRIFPDIVRLVRGVIGDRTAPLATRLALGGLLLWLINPIDVIPEFIPVLGPLDDVVVAVLVLRYVRRRLVHDDFRSAGREPLRASSSYYVFSRLRCKARYSRAACATVKFDPVGLVAYSTSITSATIQASVGIHWASGGLTSVH